MTFLLTWYRKVSQFHEQDKLIALSQTIAGRIVVCAAAIALLYPYEQSRIMMAAVGLVSIMPTARKLLLSLGFFAVQPSLGAWRQLIMGVPFYAVFLAAKHFKKLPKVVRKHPQSFLHAAMWALIGLFWLLPEKTISSIALLPVITMMPFFIWRCGYLLMAGKRGTAAKTTFMDHLYYLWPVYSRDSVPIGKGHDYLSKRESSDAEQFARSQLAGIKVLILALIWRAVSVWMGGTEDASLDLPFTDPITGSILAIPLHQMISGGIDASLPVRWMSIYFELFRVTLNIAVGGHLFVGALRLCGFYVMRNTYKPLLADTIVEFWNRFYYYFKEVLVEFFFFPTFLRWSKTPMHIRMFLAVFAAAFLGNMYYHVLLEADSLIKHDFGAVTSELAPRLIYCLLLAAGIYLSMLRQRKTRGAEKTNTAAAIRALWTVRVLGVWTFYSVIHIWNVEAEDAALADRNRFFLSLFGIEAG